MMDKRYFGVVYDTHAMTDIEIQVLMHQAGMDFGKHKVHTAGWGVGMEKEWISVDDELPPQDTEILLYNGSSVYIGSYHADVHEQWISVDDEVWTYDISEITHWQLLPKPPKELN